MSFDHHRDAVIRSQRSGHFREAIDAGQLNILIDVQIGTVAELDFWEREDRKFLAISSADCRIKCR